MSKADAVVSVIHEVLGKKSKASLKRIREACHTLGLTAVETNEVEAAAGYRFIATEEVRPEYR